MLLLLKERRNFFCRQYEFANQPTLVNFLIITRFEQDRVLATQTEE
jgi:hypothetical protein